MNFFAFAFLLSNAQVWLSWCILFQFAGTLETPAQKRKRSFPSKHNSGPPTQARDAFAELLVSDDITGIFSYFYSARSIFTMWGEGIVKLVGYR